VLVRRGCLIDGPEYDAEKPLELRRGLLVLRFLADEDIGELERIARVLPEIVLFARVPVDDPVSSSSVRPFCFRYFTF
jgi:hypothetical protein